MILFDNQMFKQLEKLMGKMTPAQKEKLTGILKDEESLKQAISKVDPEKAQKAVESLNLNGYTGDDLGKMAEELTKNPEKIFRKE